MAQNFVKEPAKLEKVKIEVSEVLKGLGIAEFEQADGQQVVEAIKSGLGKVKPVALAKVVKYIAGIKPAFINQLAEILRDLVKMHITRIINGDVKPIFEPLPGTTFNQAEYVKTFLLRAENCLKAESFVVVAKGLYYVEGWVNKEQPRESR